MTPKQQFVQQLLNLRQTGKTTATVNIDFLLRILQEAERDSQSARKKQPTKIDLDGGSF
jgi:hypothetical protein